MYISLCFHCSKAESTKEKMFYVYWNTTNLDESLMPFDNKSDADWELKLYGYPMQKKCNYCSCLIDTIKCA